MTKNANRKKFHYIYRTTCKVTGRYYIGMHSTDNLEDGYMGSGKRLWYSINKHGKENHVCEILEFFPDRSSLRAKEAKMVCEDSLTDPMCMNLKLGGEGGFDHINAINGNRKGFTDEQRQRGTGKAGPGVKEAHAKGRYQKSYFGSAGRDPREISALANLPEAKAKRKATIAEKKPYSGSKNSQYGTCWVTKDNSPRKISRLDVDGFIQQGYKLGRK